jgi:hypothetical protein
MLVQLAGPQVDSAVAAVEQVGVGIEIVRADRDFRLRALGSAASGVI